MSSHRIIRKMRAIWLLQTVSEFYPGTVEYRRSANLLSPIDIVLGQSRDESYSAIRWRPSQESNGFFLVVGGAGSGKTEALKRIGRGLLEDGFPVLVLDFHGDVDVSWLSPILMSSGLDSTIGVNPMELDSYHAHEVGLYDQRMALVELVARAVPKLSQLQRVMLTDAIEAAYRWVGIYDGDPLSWRRPPPAFPMVMDILERWHEDDEMRSRRSTINGCLSAIKAVFGHPVFGREATLSIDEILSVGARVNLGMVPDSIRYIVADTLLRKVFRALMLKGPIPTCPADDTERFRLFIMVDEAKILSKASARLNASGHILNILATEGRKFGVGLILASQSIDHFGGDLKANVSTRLIMKPMDFEQAKKLGLDIKVSASDLMALRGKGDGFFKSQGSGEATYMQVRRP